MTITQAILFGALVDDVLVDSGGSTFCNMLGLFFHERILCWVLMVDPIVSSTVGFG